MNDTKIKTKFIISYMENSKDGNQRFIELDEAINNFLEKENITENRLVDIKITPIGYFQPNDGDGELEATALVIYRA